MYCLCAQSIMWNEVKLCNHASCMDIHNEGIRQNWKDWPTENTLKVNPTTLDNFGGILRSIENEFSKHKWNKNATEKITEKWDKNLKKMVQLPKHKHRYRYPPTLTGAYFRTVDRLNTIQRIIKNYNLETIENPIKSHKPVLVECIRVKPKIDKQQILEDIQNTHKSFQYYRTNTTYRNHIMDLLSQL